MSRQYVMKKFLRQAPNDLICEYLKKLGIGEDIEWRCLRETDVDPILQAVNSSSQDLQKKVNADFDEINDMADSNGITTLIEVGRLLNPAVDLVEELESVIGNHRKALWVFLNHPLVFDKSRKVDEFTNSRSHPFDGLPALPEGWDWQNCKELLRQSISNFYKFHEGRGEGCEIDHDEIGGKHYWFVYLEDHTDIVLGFNDQRQLDWQLHRPMFSISYRYDENDRTLEVAGVTKKDQVEELRDIFTRVIFGCELKDAGAKKTYHLKHLLNPDFELQPQPDLGVVECRLKRVKLNAHGRTGLTMTLESGEQSGRRKLQECIASFLRTASISVTDAQVQSVAVQIVFAPESGRRKGKTLTFVTYPGATTLKSNRKCDVARECLKRWGVDTNRASGDRAAKSASVVQSVIPV